MARGFASMTPERRSEIASQGGRAAHKLGRAHQFSSEEARAAGQKGGRTIGKDSGYMSIIGTIGGNKRFANLQAKADKKRAGRKKG